MNSAFFSARAATHEHLRARGTCAWGAWGFEIRKDARTTPSREASVQARRADPRLAGWRQPPVISPEEPAPAGAVESSAPNLPPPLPGRNRGRGETAWR